MPNQSRAALGPRTANIASPSHGEGPPISPLPARLRATKAGARKARVRVAAASPKKIPDFSGYTPAPTYD